MRTILACLLLLTIRSNAETKSGAVTDYTNYNVGETVRVRLLHAKSATLTIRYRGKSAPVAEGIRIAGADYATCWQIPSNATTGRYDVDLIGNNGVRLPNVASFAVHRQLVKVTSVTLDKTFYTSGDAVDPTITVRNVSSKALDHIQVEFESYTYPWIAPSPDEPVAWKTVVDGALSLAPGEEKTFLAKKAAVVQADKEPVAIYYSVVLRDSRDANRIYDLAFAPPAFTTPPNTPLPKQYPFLYLYWHLNEERKSQAYRQFYPPEYVSDEIAFDKSHTMFAAGVAPEVQFTVTLRPGREALHLRTRVTDAGGRELESQEIGEQVAGEHRVPLRARDAGLYMLHAELLDAAGTVADRNQIELAVNPLPKSILIFCAHQDDDTAHPGIIRAAAENHVPIHFVYWTGGDAGGCDRFYMHSCDAARAMDFGEVRTEEARASLGHLGVPRDAVEFLGMPDGGMEQIWFDHPHDSDPYLSVLLASEHSPYAEAAIPNMPYSRDAAIAAAKQFIERYQPDLIITGHPDERHVDHRVNNWIVVEAMQELLAAGKLPRETQLLVDVVYGAMPGRHAPYRFEKQHFYVSGEAAKLGQEATWYYQSQDGNHEQANIVDFDKLPRQEPFPHYRIVDWYAHPGWTDKRAQ